MDKNEINENAEERGFDESTASDEEHRFDEFEETMSILNSILEAVSSLRNEFDAMQANIANLAQQRAAVLVESGEIVTDDGETAVVDLDSFEPLDELDLEI